MSCACCRSRRCSLAIADASAVAVEAGERAGRAAPGFVYNTQTARERLALLDGTASRDQSEQLAPIEHRTLTAGTMWLLCRESIDAGEPSAVDKARPQASGRPHACAVLAAVDGAATGDEERCHEALSIALEQGLRLIAVDALEGLAVAAARSESPVESMRLVGAAWRLRQETGYAWRFPFEERAVDSARRDAAEALGIDAESALERGPRPRVARRRHLCTTRPWRTKAPVTRMGQPDPDRAASRRARRGRAHEPRDRGATADGTGNGEDTPGARLHQARRALTCRARRARRHERGEPSLSSISSGRVCI